MLCTLVSVAILHLSAQAQGQAKVLPKLLQDTYSLPTMEALAGLYWSLGALEIENDDYIDKYMMITNCPIFKEFYVQDDWLEIREGGRVELKKRLKNKEFRNNIRFVIPIVLGEYDEQAQSFAIAPPYDQFDGRRFITQAYLPEDYPVCGMTEELAGYPKNLLVELGSAIPLPEVTIPKDKADVYLQAVEESGIGRIAYLKIDVKIMKFEKYMIYKGDRTTRAQVYGRLEGIGVYADQDLTWEMMSEDLRRRL